MYTDSLSPMSIQDHWAMATQRLFDLFGLKAPPVHDLPAADATREPKTLAAVQYLSQTLDGAELCTQPVCQSLAYLQQRFHWSQNINYTDQEFLRGYAYCEIVGPTGHIAYPDLSMGLLLLQPHLIYPEHLHPANETYAVLSGRALWKQGADVWKQRAPGDLINHASMESHAMRTLTEPLLAAYLWRDHLHVSAKLLTATSFA